MISRIFLGNEEVFFVLSLIYFFACVSRTIKNPSNGGTEALYDIYNLFDDYRILSVFS